MKNEVKLRIRLEEPTAGIDFGIQKGSGNNYETIQRQRSAGHTLSFEFCVELKQGAKAKPVFVGPFTHGTPGDRFIYIDIGTYAGQSDSVYGRRIKIPLREITGEMVDRVLSDRGLVIEAAVPGKGKDGGPNSGTVKNFGGWLVK